MSPLQPPSTRRPPDIDVFHHQLEPHADCHAAIEDVLLKALRPLRDQSGMTATNAPHNSLKLLSTTEDVSAASPSKTDSSPLRPMPPMPQHHLDLADVSIPPPRPRTGQHLDFAAATAIAMSPTKNAAFYSPRPPPMLQPDAALFAVDHHLLGDSVHDYGFKTAEGRPVVADLDTADHAYDFQTTDNLPGVADLDTADHYGFKATGKRPIADSAPFKERPGGVKKPKFDDDHPFSLPNPEDMPTVLDDGTKPPHSYATLIGMAILRSPLRRLTLAQIYKWISDNYSFYRLAETGWQNSIRHNLSLNKNFLKQERPKDDPGKGNYWAIKPGQERPFLVDKKHHIRRITNPDGSHYLHGLTHDMSAFRNANNVPAIGHFTLAPSSNPSRKAEAKTIDTAQFPDENDDDDVAAAVPASDGTIPASDPALNEDDDENGDDGEDNDDNLSDRADVMMMPPPPASMRSSPPPDNIDYSPAPVPSRSSKRKDTPPPLPRFPSTSRSGGRRVKYNTALNDSGYWSSLESSAVRNAVHHLNSDADLTRPRIKKGRAEAEIARLRSSSFGSPGLEKRAPGSSNFLPPQPSSPSRAKDDSPSTPSMLFKRPPKPLPPSLSPNTNLRDHRNRLKELLGSPAKAFTPLRDVNTWSPAFNVHEDVSLSLTPFLSPYRPSNTPLKPFEPTPGMSTSKLFDIFIDAPEEDPTARARGSPEKRSAKRPSLVRAATTAGILADITGNTKANTSISANGVNLSAPSEDQPFQLSPFAIKQGPPKSPARLGSPLKQMHRPSVSQPTVNLDWFGEENLHPGRPLGVMDAAELFGVELPSDGSEEGIDLFQDFGKIGQQHQQQLQHQQSRLAGPGAMAPDRSTGSPVRRTNMLPPARPVLGRSTSNRW